jgi:hypothetical protein
MQEPRDCKLSNDAMRRCNGDVGVVACDVVFASQNHIIRRDPLVN